MIANLLAAIPVAVLPVAVMGVLNLVQCLVCIHNGQMMMGLTFFAYMLSCIGLGAQIKG